MKVALFISILFCIAIVGCAKPKNCCYGTVIPDNMQCSPGASIDCEDINCQHFINCESLVSTNGV